LQDGIDPEASEPSEPEESDPIVELTPAGPAGEHPGGAITKPDPAADVKKRLRDWDTHREEAVKKASKRGRMAGPPDGRWADG
jgi:hypothetical protein